MVKTNPKPIEQMTYEEVSAELEAVVAALESEQRSLEEAMILFERGQNLVKRSTELLDKAELKVRQLSGESLTEITGDE